MLHLKLRQLGGRTSARDLRRAATLILIAFLMALSVARLAGAAENSRTADSGIFTILSNQHQIGTEKFKITQLDSGLEATGEIQVDVPGSPRISETCFLRVDGKLQPTSYERQQKSPKKGTIFAQFGPQGTKLTSKAPDQIFFLPDNHLVVLDTNFFHHYSLLLRQYDASQAGVQQFTVFVPQEATPGIITLELQGKENQTVGKTSRELNHFQAITEQVKIEIWATPDGAIYRMSIPQANMEVVRQ